MHFPGGEAVFAKPAFPEARTTHGFEVSGGKIQAHMTFHASGWKCGYGRGLLERQEISEEIRNLLVGVAADQTFGHEGAF